MIRLFKKYTDGKKVLILGFGREGRSTFRFIRAYFPDLHVGVADKNKAIGGELLHALPPDNIHTGDAYLQAVQRYDVIIKSPGIQLNGDAGYGDGRKWLSQTRLFLECFRHQVIGVTGTKGKSTTSSLIFHLLKSAGKDAVLLGNIGKPPFDLLAEIREKTTIVFELSANQLEHVKDAPHISVLLNLFPEHLDYFGDVKKYYRAKMNICRFQEPGDVFIYDDANQNLQQQLRIFKPSSGMMALATGPESREEPFGKKQMDACFKSSKLKGAHNRKNMLAAAIAVASLGVGADDILSGIQTFSPLPHRLEYVGRFCDIDFYNDSISTIPESTIEAVKTLPRVRMLILGGFDRGIGYEKMLRFLASSGVAYFAFTGPAGLRMMQAFHSMKKQTQQCRFFNRFEEIFQWFSKAGPGNACLLSPAAPSYDAFRDFEERGNAYKKMAENFTTSCQ